MQIICEILNLKWEVVLKSVQWQQQIALLLLGFICKDYICC